MDGYCLLIAGDMIDSCMDEIPIEVNRDFIKNFILKGQKIVNDLIEKI